MSRRSRRWLTSPILALGLGSVSYGCLLFVWFLLPAFLAPVIDDLGLNGWQAGILTGAIPLTYVPLSLVSGLVIDRIGPRWGIGPELTATAVSVVFAVGEIGGFLVGTLRDVAGSFVPGLAVVSTGGVAGWRMTGLDERTT